MQKKRKLRRKPKPTGITLRPPQKEAVAAIRREWEQGRSTLLAAATGIGKTEVFLAALAEDMEPGDRALILAHRQELIDQPVERIHKHWQCLGTPGIVMADKNQCGQPITIATVQTLSRSEKRLDAILSQGPITHVVTDEAHHSTADTYVALYERLAESGPFKHLGVTATPRRADETGLKAVFDTVAYKYGIKQAIKDGYLSPFVAYGIYLKASIEDVSEDMGDWTAAGVGEVMSARGVLDTMVNTWLERCPDEPTLAFCATVEQAHALAEAFHNAGIPAASADHKTPKDERRQIIKDFKNGLFKVLCNNLIWTEGLDLPMVRVIFNGRPTQNDSLYVQMVGRGLRTWPGKATAQIFDFIPHDARNMRLAGDLLDGRPRKEKKAVDKAEETGVILDCFGIDRDGEGIDGDPDEVLIKVLDYFAQSYLAWTADGSIATCGVSDAHQLGVIMPSSTAAERIAAAEHMLVEGYDLSAWDDELRRLRDLAQFRLYAVEREIKSVEYERGRFGRQVQKRKLGKQKTVVWLGTFGSWEDAAENAEGYAERHLQDILAEKGKSWRDHPASDGQAKLLRRYNSWRDGMTKGEAGQAITHCMVRGTLEREKVL